MSMQTGRVLKLIVLALCVAAAGCATSRSELKLTSPTAVAPAASSASGRTAVIRSVKDERVFEQAPRDPSTPSLGSGGAEQATAEIKARAIGRKRNSYGKALGDVLLESGQTVEQVIRENLAAALQEAGFQVKADVTDAGPSPLVIDVHIKQFWAWFQPGFWAIKLNANIATDLDIAGGSPVSVSVRTVDSRQMATDGAWMEIVQQALQEYRVQAKAKVSVLP